MFVLCFVLKESFLRAHRLPKVEGCLYNAKFRSLNRNLTAKIGLVLITKQVCG